MSNIDELRVKFYPAGGGQVDITDYVDAAAGIVIAQGINGGQDTDIIASPGKLVFTLNNSSGLFTPAGASVMAGWATNAKIEVVLDPDYEWVMFTGWVRSIEPVYKIGEIDRVVVTCYDWLEQAIRVPIVAPPIQRNKTMAQAAQAVLDLCPVPPLATIIDTGTTFITVFDSVTGKTNAYGELSKIAQSEWGHLFCRRDGTLQMQSAAARDTMTERAFEFFFTLEDGSQLITEIGDSAVLEQTTVALELIRDAEIKHGRYYANLGKVTAYPRRVDSEPVVIARTPQPIPIAAGESKKLTLAYVDLTGVSKQVAASTDAMETITPGLTVDPTLGTLLHFDLPNNAVDDVARMAWAMGDSPMVFADVYQDGYGTQRIGGGAPIGGSYAIFGGYSNYKVTAPYSSWLDFGTGAFTIGWWEARIDVTAAEAAIGRDETTIYTPWLLGYLVTASMDMRIYMSSNGATWDIANGRSLGKVAASRWVHYEVSRAADGWFYAFANGKLTDKWYSSLAIPSGYPNALAIGRTQGNWAYTAIAEYYIHKGKCLHTADFETPRVPHSKYLDEDYWGNTLQNRSGTALALTVGAPTYGTHDMTVTITNNSGVAGYIYFQQRGKGIYFDAAAEYIAQDVGLIAVDGYNELSINQRYQHETATGAARMDVVIANRKIKRNDLVSVTFDAGASDDNVLIATQFEIGDLLRVRNAKIGIDGLYAIQAFDIRFSGFNDMTVKLTLKEYFGA